MNALSNHTALLWDILKSLLAPFLGLLFLCLIYAWLNRRQKGRATLSEMLKGAIGRQLNLEANKEEDSSQSTKHRTSTEEKRAGQDESRPPTREEKDLRHLQDNPEEALINIRHRLETDENNIFQHLSAATQEEIVRLYHRVTVFVILRNLGPEGFRYYLNSSQACVEIRKSELTSDHQKEAWQKIKNASKKWHKHEYKGVVRYTLPLKWHGDKLVMDTQEYFNS